MDEQKRAIIESVKNLFFTYGCDGVSMSQIAGELRMSKKTIYKVFDSKEHMVLCIVEDILEKLKFEFENILHDPRMDFQEKIRLSMKKQIEVFTEIKPPFLRDIVKLKKLSRYIENSRKQLIKHFELLFREGRENNLLRRDVDVRILNEIILAGVDGIILADKLKDLSMTLDQAMEQIFRICLYGAFVKNGHN